MADAILDGEPYSLFPNGFPLLIAMMKILLPETWMPLSLVSFNIIVSTAAIGLGMQISKKITGNTFAACLTGLIIAVYPNQLNYVRQILTEAPTTFFLVLSAFFFLKRKYFISGIFLITTVLFRSSFLPLVPLMVICFYFFVKNENIRISGVKYFGGMAIAYTCYAILLLLGVVKSSSNLSQNLLISINSYSQHIDFSMNGFTAAQKEHAIKTYFMFILDHPAEYLKQRILSFNELWGWPSTGEPPRTLVTKLMISLRIPILVLAMIGFLKNLRQIKLWVPFLPILVITIIHTLFFSTTRFTYVIEPFAIILAVIGFLELFKIPINREKL